MSLAAILLVEDDESIANALVERLTRARHTVRWCPDGASAIAAAGEDDHDLVFLDLGLPDLDGVDVCRAVRARLPASVIVILSARDTEIDVAVALEAGADDYLAKPVGGVELVARVRAHLRRAAAVPTGPGPAVHLRVLGPLRVDEATRRAWLGDEELPLRRKQFQLLARLLSEPGSAVSREALIADVWDEHWFGSTKTLDVHIAGLRRVLDDAARREVVPAPRIVTLRGYGYRLEPAS